MSVYVQYFNATSMEAMTLRTRTTSQKSSKWKVRDGGVYVSRLLITEKIG